MTSAVCSCGRPVADAFVCRACIDALAVALGDTPALAGELETTLTRQARIGEPAGRPGGETPLPFHHPASEAGWVLWTTLVAWTRAIHTPGESWPDDAPVAMARWLLARVNRIRAHPDGGQAVDEITAAVAIAWRVIDRPPRRWYAGRCDTCGEHLYAAPAAVRFTCPECGTGYDTATRQDWLRTSAEDQLAHAALASQALTTLARPVTPERIRQWAARGQLAAHSVDAHGRPLYRIGEIIGLLARAARHEKQAC